LSKCTITLLVLIGFGFAAATASDASAAAVGETAVTDCQAAVDSLCLNDDDDGTSYTFSSH